MLSRREIITTQDAICSYLEKAKSTNDFEITGKIENQSSDSRFYNIIIDDVRMDQLIIQMTPSIVKKDAILEITKEGKLNLLGSNFKPLDCNLNFSFKNGQLHSYIDENALNRKKHPCYLVKWGIFASVAAAAVITIGPQLLAAAQKELTNGLS